MLHRSLLTFLLLAAVVPRLSADPLPDLRSIPEDLTIPAVTLGPPGPGKRSLQTLAAWQADHPKSQVHHLLYLPTDWQPGKTYPVLVEYAGNGAYLNQYGDSSDGTVSDSRLGYGISGGRGFIWLCLPYIEEVNGIHRNAIKWWGNLADTGHYCLATVQDTCTRYGGDPTKLILCGFSRGSIACNYLGLHDDQIAPLWCAFICHSHYDGLTENWPYPAADRLSALERLKRLNGRPQWISHEASTRATEAYLQSTHIPGNWTFTPIPFHNHSDAWVLRNIPERQKLRDWVQVAIRE